MSVILADGIGSVVFHNGLLRIECVATGADQKGHPSGTLLIPAPQVGAVLNALIHAAREVDQQLRNQAKQTAASRDAAGQGADATAPIEDRGGQGRIS
jgi:hypothetical protein